MGSLNVNRSVSDPFYRYKMPRLLAKVEGKGNGIKTVIVNMIEVAKALGRPPTYPIKYFGCELGAQTTCDNKTNRYIVNGSHDAPKLQELLDGFIHKFVLCPSCDNPETILSISAKKGIISQTCIACGFHGPLEFNHKLNTFILKNPPELDPTTQGSSLTEGKRNKRSKKNADSTTNGDGRSSPKSDDSDSDKLKSIPEKKVASEDEPDANWTIDVSAEAVKQRQLDLTDGVKNLTMNDDLEKTEKERLDIYYNFVKRIQENGGLENSKKELLSEAERLEIKAKATLILAELLFNQNIHTQVKKYRLILLHFTHENRKAQKYLLGGIENTIGLHKEALLPKVPAILKLFYDLDILEEKVLLEWAEKVSKKYVSKELNQEIHARAEPFISWLREAEEESESDSEDDLEIEYDDRAKASPLKESVQKAPPRPAAAKDDDDEEDDLNIDDI